MVSIRTLIVYVALIWLSASAQAVVGPCDIDAAPQGDLLYITASAGKQILVLNTTSNTIEKRYTLPEKLSGLCVSQDGKTLYATGGGAEGKVFEVDASDGTLLRTIPCGHTPGAPVLSPDGETLYICNRFNNDVAFIELGAGAITDRIPVSREPVAAGLSSDGKRLFVANLLPNGRADQEYVAAQISVIDTDTHEVTAIPLLNGAEGLRGIKISPDGKTLYATHFVARFLVSTTQLERGWVSTDGLSIIRTEDLSLLHTVLLDDTDMAFASPWALDFSDDGESLIVTAAGSHEVSVIDIAAMNDRLIEPANPQAQNAYKDLSMLSGIRQRISLEGNGPRAIAVVGDKMYIAHYFSDTVEVVSLNRGETSHAIIPLSTDPSQPIERLGEQLFHDATLSFQQWLSCATCHPDGRSDALNWDLVNDGIGNPKNAKSLLLAHKTPRSMWLGIHENAEETVRHEIRSILFSMRPEEEAAAIDAYLKSLKPEPSPYLINGAPSAAAQRGKELFELAGCMACHEPPLYTDLRQHNLGTLLGQDTGKSLDTPSLIEVWRTAPYQHDGRARTLRDVIDLNHAGNELSEAQKEDLVEYLRTL